MKEPVYEKQLPYLSHADLPTEDERIYVPPQVGLVLSIHIFDS